MRKQYGVHTISAKIAAKSKEAPAKVLLFAKGEVEIEREGTVVVDAEAFELLQANIQRRGVEIPWDYEHQTVLTSGKAPAAGWIKNFRWLDDAGIEVDVEWTEEAAKYIAKNEYRYFSPVFYRRKSDNRLCGVHSVALTNTPKTNNLKPLLAKLGAQYKTDNQEEGMKLKELIIAALKLKEDASDEEIIAALAKVQEDGAKTPKTVEVITKDILTALDLDTGDASTVVASIHALKQQEKGMVSKADFDALVAKLNGRDADDLVIAALKDGKITPDQKDWATDYATRDLAGFKTFVAKAPVVVPVSDLPPGETITAKVGITDAVALGAAFGNSEEDIKQYGA